MLETGAVDFIVQGCAQVTSLIEYNPRTVVMVDTFLFPTKELALSRRGVPNPEILGQMPAASEYVDISAWKTVIEENANSIVARKFIEGTYDSAITFAELADQYPERFYIQHHIGRVNMAWLVYARSAVARDGLPGGYAVSGRMSLDVEARP